MLNLFNPLAPYKTFRGWRLLGAFRMRHEKHTQSFSIPEALVLPRSAAAAGDPMSVPLLLVTSHLCIQTNLCLCHVAILLSIVPCTLSAKKYRSPIPYNVCTHT